MTLEALLTGGFVDALEAAFDESREPLVFRGTFPDPEFLQKLVEKFMSSTTPRSFRRVLLISEDDMHEATSASFHLPQAYETIFPCPHCTGHKTLNETYHTFIEVFHFPNRNDPSVCASVSFRVSADNGANITDYITTSDSRVEMYLTETCLPPRASFVRPSRKLFTQFDTSFGVLRELSPDGLEKLQAVSRGCRATIDRHRTALPRRKLIAGIDFNDDEDLTVVTVVISWSNDKYDGVRRMLVPRSPEQLSRMLRVHLRNALVLIMFISWERSFRHPPQGAMLRCDESKALAWAIRLFESLKRTQVERVKFVSELFGIDNLPAVMKAARFSRSVGTLHLIKLSYDDAFTMRQVVDLLRDPTAVASEKIIVGTV